MVIRMAAARSIRAHRLNRLSDSTCAGTGRCFEGHRILGTITVSGVDWGERIVSELMRMGTVAYGIVDLRPRFGIRFAGPRDTTDILLDTVDSLRTARVAFRWWDTSGRRASAFARMPFSFVGDPDADSTLRKLQRPAITL